MSNYILTYWASEGVSGTILCDTLPAVLTALAEQHRCGGMFAFDITGSGEIEEQELAYWQLCLEHSEVVTAMVREHVSKRTGSSLLLARIYYLSDTYRCHRCGTHWQGKGTLFPCVHPRKSVCKNCQGKCAIDKLTDEPESWMTLEAAAVEAGYTVKYIGQTVQIGTPRSSEHGSSVAVFLKKSTSYDDAVRWLRHQERSS